MPRALPLLPCTSMESVLFSSQHRYTTQGCVCQFAPNNKWSSSFHFRHKRLRKLRALYENAATESTRDLSFSIIRRSKLGRITVHCTSITNYPELESTVVNCTKNEDGLDNTGRSRVEGLGIVQLTRNLKIKVVVFRRL